MAYTHKAAPSEIPYWTVDPTTGVNNDVVDPTSGQNNVVVPPVAKQQQGWDFKEKPPRNWFNWLGRWTSRWLRFFSDEWLQSGTFTMTSSDLGGSQPWTVQWWRHRSILILRTPDMTGTSSSTACSYTGIPSNLQPLVATGISALHWALDNTVETACIVLLSSAGGGTLQCTRSVEGSGGLSWTAAGAKGLRESILIFPLDNPT